MRALSEIGRNLEYGTDGIWTSRNVSAVSYPDEGNDIYYAVEDSSFWFRHRNACIIEAVRHWPPDGAIFDIGGGNGYVARGLQDAGWEVVLVEPGAGAANARRRGIEHVVRAAFQDAGFAPGTLPAVGLFDVIEHTEDDAAFLHSLAECLAPGGRVYVTVPAGQWMWSHEDDIAGHYRRYDLASLSRLMSGCEMEVEYATCIFGFLPPATFLRRVLPYRLGIKPPPVTLESVRADHEIGGMSARIVERLARRELNRVRRGEAIRSGGSCLAVARKKH
jgi:SAM-dependent methyltransferase